ncbi:hypothetical protein AMATHDRAFT_5445 [Amanita thiersii Skay4041]|uniref:RRM domain-containing protein n=1 Tax=Amanita thiersii Skay4041 TaxID=703135 RepID=A0A2A9NM23_9AGAR|nr:hypothetical protein AMATHDRAFT_5445 [Amanita thiersii Skay4041]
MSLGKRKERDGEELSEQQIHHGSTLFVSNLPYTATSTDLQTLFSEAAPVRNAFVVCEHGTGVSKGVGYVSFGIREDAETAYNQVSQGGLTLAGRKLRVQWAEQKMKAKNEKSVAPNENKMKVPRPQKLHVPTDPLSICTVVISGLPTSIDSKMLWKKIRKYNGAKKVEWPIKADGEADDPTIAHAIFSTPSTAQDAVNKLHAHVFKGSLLSVSLKKRLDTLAPRKPTNVTTSAKNKTPQPSVHTTPSHANRLIVRNLPFNATEQDLRAVFLPYGPIYSINIPTKESTTAATVPDQAIDPGASTTNDTSTSSIGAKDNQDASPPSISAQLQHRRIMASRGFAFIWYYSKKDAERALEGCNGAIVRAGAAEDLVKDKQKRKKQKRLEKKLAALATVKEKEKVAGGDEDVENQEKDENEDTEEDKNKRVIAVDWALSKDRWKEEKAKIDESMKDEGGEDSDQAGNSKEDIESASGSEDGDERSDSGIHDGDSDTELGSSDMSDNESVDEERDENDKPVKPQLPAVDIGTTLFIRNIPFDAAEDELRTLFRSFGPLRYARITLDPATGRSRGTGFACFWNHEDADKVIEQSQLLRAETSGGNLVAPQNKKKNPFSLPSILTPDPSSSLAKSLVLHGRTLDVVRAVTRDEAGKLKEAGERAREKADKRNMYLLREGVILPNSPAAAQLAPADLERRTNSYNARRTLLKSNPSLYVSKTRLSIRQIPLYVTERIIKRLALHAVRMFENEVLAGDRTALSAEELADPGGKPGDHNVEEYNEEDKDNASEDDDGNANNPSKSAKHKSKLKKLAHRKGGRVKQAKIVRQADRVDPVTGKGRSRGYGFVEMHTHADALRVLRWANNNPDVHSLFGKWWREELESLIKAEKSKSKNKEGEAVEEEAGARLKRLTTELEKEKQKEEGMKLRGGKEEDDGDGDGENRRNRGTLIVECSIENVQVVQRRNAIQKSKMTEREDGSHQGRKMLDDAVSSKKGTFSKDRMSQRRNESHGRKGKRIREPDDGVREQQSSPKKRKVSISSSQRNSPSKTTISMDHPVTIEPQPESLVMPVTGDEIGSIIGRKRKERRGKGKRKQ